MLHLPFSDRSEAGRLLAAEIGRRKLPASAIVLALPRGGVAIGFEVAQALHLSLDVVVVRKIGVPWKPELAMGAIAGESVVLDWQLIRALGISQQEIDAVVEEERAEMERREKMYRRGRPAPDLRGRTAILVDDGLATGSTMLAAARYVRAWGPESLKIAVPVGSSEACELLKGECDEVICLATPKPFVAVGEWYADFEQVSDADVTRLMGENQGHVA
jgi:putative phosphoribosyl transferase